MSPARFYGCALAALAVLVPLHLVLAGVVPQTIAANDFCIQIDAGWRTYCGLRPHADYYMSLGPVMPLFVGTGFLLFGPNLEAYAYMNALMFPALAGAGWFLLKDRVSPFWCFWICLLVAITFVAPFAIRLPVEDTTYALAYNRHGYALFSLFAAVLLCPADMLSLAGRRIASAMLGMLAATLIFLKISFFGVVVPLLVAIYALEGRRWMLVGWTLGGGALASLPFLAAIGFDIPAMMSDLATTAEAKSRYWVLLSDKIAPLYNEMVWWMLACLFIAGLGIHSLRHVADGRDLMAELAVALLMIGVSVVIVFSNAVWGSYPDFPSLVLLAALLVVRLTHKAAGQMEGASSPITWRLMHLLGVVFVTLYVARVTICSVWDFSGICDLSRTFDSPRLASYRVDQKFNTGGFVGQVNAGLEIARKHNIAQQSFVVMDFTSPLHFALMSRPVGGSPFMDYAINFSTWAAPSPARYLQDARYILIPKVSTAHPTSEILLTHYAAHIEAHYTQIDENYWWKLLERRNAAGP
ncbi:hypothetical protein DB346_14685 [Verrucomicrobia bacterium LW23]|nr:hypothetical protein DB346_14685 [Verrucomicrobia bacterium LW23]